MTVRLLSVALGLLAASALSSAFHHRTSSRETHHVHHSSLFDSVDTASIDRLPIYDIIDDIRGAFRGDKSNLLLEASPGAGKTSVVPLLISSLVGGGEERGDGGSGGRVIVVEPRRVATRSAAQRMADLINQRPGGSVGYAIRGESRQSSATEVLVCTDGVLLNMLRRDPELVGTSAVVLDEFHERGLGSDTAFALLRQVQETYRPDLRLVVMSATLLGSGDGDETSMGARLVKTLGGEDQCAVLKSEGRQYPVTYQHAQSRARHRAMVRDTKLLVETMADAIQEGLIKAPAKGDLLAFLPGVKEIKRTIQELKKRGVDKVFDIFPLYGALPRKEQDKAIYSCADSGRRRIIVSSPIAEASLTIDGVTCVVDSGFQRQPRYDANTGLPLLVTVVCSKDSSIQRAGRAGRTQEGLCIRLFSEAEFDSMAEHAVPEIQSSDLVPTVLLLSDWGCLSASEILEAPFLDAPDEQALDKAYQLLLDLEAVEEYRVPGSRDNKRYKVTEEGMAIANIPTHPRMAMSILKATEPSDLVAALTVSAFLDDQVSVDLRESNLAICVREILSRGAHTRQLLDFASRNGDRARDAMVQALDGRINPKEVADCVGRALLPGFVDLIAQRKGDASYGGSLYMLSLGQSARLDDRQEEGEYILVVDSSTGDDGKVRIRKYCKLDSADLKAHQKQHEEIYTVASKGYEVRKRLVTKVGSLILSTKPLPSPSSEEVTTVLSRSIKEEIGGVKGLFKLQTKKKQEILTQILNRISLARTLGDDSWSSSVAGLAAVMDGNGKDDDEDALLETIEPWLGAATSLKGVDLLAVLTSQLSAEEQSRLDQFYPTTLVAPDGFAIPISYDTEVGPIASAKLQQFFGTNESPTVGPPGHETPVTLSLLSPAGRQLAQTKNLPFFWREAYPSVVSEMKGRYPKHAWPDDPGNATPSRLTKKQQSVQLGGGNGGKQSDKRKKKKRKR
ncbi:hypothetical protein THAOC_06680 [Thalassiosira oceanica]|uniref:Helicase ATP-binding domain-containing protein n=1 Tax=Thalassiosira oceanica TaxID=159749 RepID=K0SZP8_THAOC|nr:hypothetical protein THAOC_06680 [Thalassiosira oceanica]|eukprot:EJK71838.1 hypothetical protein THAOC_06680 [Thalassiosira oceanica]